MGPLSGLVQEAIALPIPNLAALAGQAVFVQSVHFDPAGPAASGGLAVTIL